MILRPEQIRLMRLGCPVIPANGGDSDSQANTNTTNNTTNNVTSTDRRVVASEEVVALSGDGNTVTRNDVQSTSFTDASDRSTTTITTTTDFGSVTAALGGMERVSSRVVDSSQIAINGAIDSLNRTGANSLTLSMKAFDMASAQSANASTSAAQVLGFATNAMNDQRAAFAEAKDGGQNKTLLLAAAAVVGVVGLAAAMK